MSVSKRLRYEVLRRDNHQCRYCGAAAPDAILTVDHVTPTALGGSDDPSNLVAACKDCNSGKSASNPDGPMVADVAQDALRWSEAIQVAAQQMLDRLNQRDALCAEFEVVWNSWTIGGRRYPLPDNWRQSVTNFLSAGLPLDVLYDCLDIAMAAPKLTVDNVFRYMCGIAWSRVSDLQKAARQSLDAAPAAAQTISVSASDVAGQAWGYLPGEVDAEKVASWARTFRKGREDDEDQEHDFSQWPDDACGLLGALSELVDDWFSVASTLHGIETQLPPELLNACRWDARRICEEDGLKVRDRVIEHHAVSQAVSRLLRLVSTHDERAELRQQVRAELGEEY